MPCRDEYLLMVKYPEAGSESKYKSMVTGLFGIGYAFTKVSENLLR